MDAEDGRGDERPAAQGMGQGGGEGDGVGVRADSACLPIPTSYNSGMAQETQQAPLTLEARLAALEAEVAALKQRVESSQPKGWLENVIGSTKDMPDFDEVVRYGREARQAQRDSYDVSP